MSSAHSERGCGTHLHVGAVQEGVQVGQPHGGLVFEPSQQPLLDGPELLGVAAEELATLLDVLAQLCVFVSVCV